MAAADGVVHTHRRHRRGTRERPCRGRGVQPQGSRCPSDAAVGRGTTAVAGSAAEAPGTAAGVAGTGAAGIAGERRMKADDAVALEAADTASALGAGSAAGLGHHRRYATPEDLRYQSQVVQATSQVSQIQGLGRTSFPAIRS